MDFVIVTGLSGAGKTRAMHSMEDIGFFCVDNLPAKLIPTFYELCLSSKEQRSRVAVVTDTRGGEMFASLFDVLDDMKANQMDYKILFLDAKDQVLFNRYQENRRFLLLIDRIKDRNNRYFNCPKCRQTVRVPRGKGKISITCPKCREKFIKKT